MILAPTLTPFIQAARWAGTPAGYEVVRVSWVMLLDEQGNVLKPLAKLVEPRTCSLPKLDRRSSFRARVGVDDVMTTFGVGPKNAAALHADYVRWLNKVDHPATKAISAYLARGQKYLPLGYELTPEQLAEVRTANPVPWAKDYVKSNVLVGRGDLTTDAKLRGMYRSYLDGYPDAEPIAANPNDRILIEVEGHPEWWLSPAVQQAHAERLADRDTAGEVVTGDCSICGTPGIQLTRLFEPTTAMAASLVSFNAPAWSGYGREQGYNAPTCRGCASKLRLGLDVLLGDKALTRRYRNGASDDERCMVWWTEARVPTWEALDAALDPKSTDPVPVFGDGWFATVEKMAGSTRLALRRLDRVDGAELTARIQRWRELGCGQLLAAANDLAPRFAYKTVEQVYRYFLIGEPLPAAHRRHLYDRVLDEANNPFRLALVRFFNLETPMARTLPELSYTQLGYPIVDKPHPEEKSWPDTERHAFNAGRALSRADWLQFAKGGPKRTVRHALWSALRAHPNTIVRRLTPFVSVRYRGKVRPDVPLDTFLGRMSLLDYPATYSARDLELFDYGFYYQEYLRWLRRDHNDVTESAWNETIRAAGEVAKTQGSPVPVPGGCVTPDGRFVSLPPRP